MDKKILFFDVDNTLIDRANENKLYDSAAEALRAARKKGHILFINTGRVIKYVPQEVVDCGFDGFICGCGTFVSCFGETLLHESMSARDSLELAQFIRDCGYHAVYEEKDGLFFDERDIESELSKFFIDWTVNLGDTSIRLTSDKDFRVDKVYGSFDENSDRETFHRRIEGRFDYFEHRGGVFELVPSGFSKSTGMQVVLDHLGMPVDKSYAFGDSANDLPMLKFTPNSIVMGGGEPSLFEIAAFVTKPIEDDGIRHAMEHFGLL
jgi:Cof subfamily protein (haloacid dehalogenase superfamily)